MFAKKFGCLRQTRISSNVRGLMRVDGTGPEFLKAGAGKRSRVLYKQEDLAKWVEGNAYQSTSQYR